MEVGLLNILRIYDYFPLALLLIFVSLLVRNLISLFCFVSDLGLEAEPGGGGPWPHLVFLIFTSSFFWRKVKFTQRAEGQLHKERNNMDFNQNWSPLSIGWPKWNTNASKVWIVKLQRSVIFVNRVRGRSSRDLSTIDRRLFSHSSSYEDNHGNS